MTQAEHNPMTAELVGPVIDQLFDEHQMGQVKAALAELQDPEVADVLEAMEPSRQAVVFRLLDEPRRAEVFAHLEQDHQEVLVEALNDEQVGAIFNEMDPDDRVDFLEEVDDEKAEQLLELMEPEERAETEGLLEYPEESVGREMTPDFLTVKREWTVADALAHIREHGREAETIHTLYVVDREDRLIDHVKLKSVLLGSPFDRMEVLREGKIVALDARDDREAAVGVMERYDLPVLPVVDGGKMVGIVTFDDIADVAEEEVTEDMHKMGGMAALEEPYRSATLMELVRKRVVWLMVLFFGGILTVWAMGGFKESIEKYVILALFVPLIIASGGNSGSQAASLMIRSLAIGELAVGDWKMVFRREVVSGLLLGSVLGVCGLIAGSVAAVMVGTEEAAWVYGFAIGTSLVGVVMMGTLTGSMLPFFLKKMGLDEATSSTPFVATIVDVGGLVLYFVVASVVLGVAG